MKITRSLLAVVAIAATLGGCIKNQSAKAAIEQIQKSFEKADDSTRKQIYEVTDALQQHNYSQSIGTMDRVVQGHTLDADQKKAVETLIAQTRQAVDRNPQLNSAELYQATTQLINHAHGEN